MNQSSNESTHARRIGHYVAAKEIGRGGMGEEVSLLDQVSQHLAECESQLKLLDAAVQ